MATYHPAVIFIYFLSVIGFGMCNTHPGFLAASFAGALIFALLLGRRSAAKFALGIALPVALLSAILNPLFNHQGVTVFATWRDHSYTVESIYFGAAWGALFAGILLWCYCYGKVMNSEKLLAVFGNILPRTALLFVMTLRLIPHYRHRISETGLAMAGLAGGSEAAKSLPFSDRLKGAGHRFSIVTTWALESAVKQADSMAQRGYSSGKRSHYSPYVFRKRDGVLLLVVLLLDGMILTAMITGAVKATYLPVTAFIHPVGKEWLGYIAFGLLSLLPLLLEGKEAAKWRR